MSTWIQSKLGTNGGVSSTSTTAAFTSNNTLGNLLIAEVRDFSSGAPTISVTDSAGNTWIQAPGSWVDGSARISFWYVANCRAGANTVTLTSTMVDFLRLVVSEYNTPNQIFDQTIHANGSSTSFNSGSLVTTVPTCLFGVIQNETSSATYSGVTGFTVRDATEGNLAVYDQLDVAAGTYPFAGTSSVSVAWAATLYSFKAPAVPPAPASVNPITGTQGATISNFTVSGTNFDAGGTSTLSFSGTGITVNSYGTRNATTLVANITIAGGATLGARDVIITNASLLTGTLSSAFTIISALPPPNPISISPTSGQQGTTLSAFVVSGTNFDVAGTSTISFSGTGITVNSYGLRNATTIVVNVTIAGNATLSARSIIVTNLDTQSATLPLAFTVVVPFTPNIFVPLPFGDRMTACAAVFVCIGIAAPTGVQTLAFGNAAIIGPLQLAYAQLLRAYALLINTDTANLPADLNSAINTAVTVIASLNSTIQAMSATGDDGIKLAGMKIVTANALASIQKVQEDEAGTPF